MRLLAMFVILMSFSSWAVADRSVSIAVPGGSLELVNGSDVSVNYTVQCYDRTTGSNVITDGSNQTIAAKASRVFQSAGVCQGGASPTYKSTQGPFACSGSVTFANAGSVCGADSSLCTISALQAKSITSLQAFPHGYWVGVTGTLWYAYSYGKEYPQDMTVGGKVHAPTVYSQYSKGPDYLCNQNQSQTGAISHCSMSDTNYSAPGALCCPNNNGFKSCKVTIHATTPAGGHLQSPQFKGGTSF